MAVSVASRSKESKTLVLTEAEVTRPSRQPWRRRPPADTAHGGGDAALLVPEADTDFTVPDSEHVAPFPHGVDVHSFTSTLQL